MSKVLIIEDNPTINMLLQRALMDEGYDVLQAYDGKTGLLSLERETPNLVMIDLNLPNLSGREVLDIMRSEAKFRDIPVIIITGNISASDDFPGDGSYQALFFKPFDLFEVINKVKELSN